MSIQREALITLLVAIALLTASQIMNAANLIVLNNIVVLAVFASATNLLIGTSGLMSLGQACFFGVGSYTVALAWQHDVAPFWLAAIAAPVIGGVAALAIGALALRTHRWFFALIMMAFSQLFFTFCQKAFHITGGDNGVFGPMLPDALLDPRGASGFIIGVACLLILSLRIVDRSPLGLTLRAARDNDRRVLGLGVSVYLLRLKAFTISGVFCAAAGVLEAVNHQGAYPGLLDWNMSGIPVLVCVIGGMYVFIGPILGAVVYQFCHDALVLVTTRWQLGLGLILLAVVLLTPGGLSEALLKLKVKAPSWPRWLKFARGRAM